MPNIIEHMEKMGAIESGHFVYQSGLHGCQYLRKDLLSRDILKLDGFCNELVFRADPFTMLVVPVFGAIIGGSYVARHQSVKTWASVALCYAEKTGEGFVLKRGYDEIVRGHNVTIFEDIITTGGSVKKVMAAVERCGGTVTQILGLVNRSPTIVSSETFGGIPLTVLAEYQMEAWPEDECPLCKDGVIPVSEKFGHGSSFLARQTA